MRTTVAPTTDGAAAIVRWIPLFPMLMTALDLLHDAAAAAAFRPFRPRP